MTPEQFIARWTANKLTERGGAQAHFDDLCELLGVDKPRDAENYCFERGAKKSGGGDGWADVWKRGHFGWENKKPGRDLKAALKQLTDYALELDNPPLLVVSDRERVEIHTAFTGYPDQPRLIRLADIGQPENLQTLRWVFTDPEKLRPTKSLAAITEEAAGKFGQLAEAMRNRGQGENSPEQVAHFLTQCLFCMFAEDEALLPRGIFTRLLEKAADDLSRASNRITALFKAMQNGGDYGDDTIPWFNGGLFALVDVPTLTAADLGALREASRMDWRAIDPSIFGTLFERGLNPKKRSQLGAHYTDPATIMKLVEPVIVRPLLAEWAGIRARIEELSEAFGYVGKKKDQPNAARKEGQALFMGFLERLRNYRVLDAACGSANFLYLALKTLKDIERRVNTEAEQLGLQRQVSIEVSPANVLGIELDPYAAELARVTVWIGEIQWMLQNGYPIADRPILKPLGTIENRDALINADGSEADWPACDAIVGNPPFLGDKMMRGELGAEYTEKLRRCFDGRVPGGADLVTYWFEKARASIETGRCGAAGLVSTNSIRGGANRKVLDRVVDSTAIFDAWSDLEWINDGAAVRVSLVSFGLGELGASTAGGGGGSEARDGDSVPAVLRTESLRPRPAPPTEPLAVLDGKQVARIFADLTAGDGLDLTSAKPLPENTESTYFGLCLAGDFRCPGETARQWLTLPNPNGKPNSDVVRPIYNGNDVTGRCADRWVIDFGPAMPEEDAMLFEAPFSHVVALVKPDRLKNREKSRAEFWWRLGRSRPELRKKLACLSRYIATVETSKHRVFVWLPIAVAPEHKLVVIPSDSETLFGLLSSRLHVVWANKIGGRLGVGNDPVYTTSVCFEKFPFPQNLTPRDTAGWGPGATTCDNRAAPAAPISPCAPTTASTIPPCAPTDTPSDTTDTPPATHLTANSQKIQGNATFAPESEPKEPNPAIAAAAKRLNDLREAWLNPPEWVDWVRTPEEEAAGFPLRPVAKPGKEADLKKRTLTNLYNARPAWLDHAHKALDAAVATAYGWTDYTPEMPDEEILRRLLALNLERYTTSKEP